MMPCTHAARAVGFAGLIRTGGFSVTRLGACGCRIPAICKVELSAFDDRPELTRTWCNPATRTVCREALAQFPVFYSQTGDGVRFATDAHTVAGPGAQPYRPAVAALLSGAAVPSPLTPWQGVFRLPAGSELSWADGRLRIRLHDTDLRELPSGGIRQALAQALATAPGGQLAVSGGAGSWALAQVAAQEGLPLTAVHAHIDVPVLDRRRARLAAAFPRCEITDATAAWEARRDLDQPPPPAECDPWAQFLTVRAGGLPPVSGDGVVRLLTALPSPRSWFGKGWRRLTTDQPATALAGQPARCAWSPPPSPPAPSPAEPTEPTGLLDGGAVRAAGVARSAWTPGHLVPDDARRTARVRLTVLSALLDQCAWASQTLLPVLHPAVVGAALGQRSAQARNGLLAQLLPPGLRAIDPPAQGKERLLAAAWATAHLARPDNRQKLLDRLAGSDWVRADALQAALATPTGRLRNALELHRISAALSAWPESFHEDGMAPADSAPAADITPAPLPALPAEIAARLRLGDGLSVHPLPFGGAMVIDRGNLTAVEIDPPTAEIITGATPIGTYDLPDPVRDRLAAGIAEGWLLPVGARGSRR